LRLVLIGQRAQRETDRAFGGIARERAPAALAPRPRLGQLRRRRLAELHAQVTRPAVAPHGHLDGLGRIGVGDRPRQRPRRIDRLAVEARDDVAGLDAGTPSGTIQDVTHDRALCVGQTERLGKIVVHVMDRDAEPAAPHDAGLAQIRDDAPRLIRGYREPDADAAAGRRVDRGAHADDLAARVEDGAARVALVDRRVDLQVVVIRPGADVAPACRDDAGRARPAETERIAYRDDP